jgi:hypothetical protein
MMHRKWGVPPVSPGERQASPPASLERFRWGIFVASLFFAGRSPSVFVGFE